MRPFKNNDRRKGQNVIEYLILVAGVLVVILVAASPGGIFTQGVNKALGMMSDSVENMATATCGPVDTVDGSWGGAWVNDGVCGTYVTCAQRQIQNTCIGAVCGGTCSGAYPTQDVDCCCGNGVCEASEDCSTCSDDCGAC
ncbi:MAG: hypothetical protein HY210_07605 [Candidatus Omnitrophica bacterium]|nr:hypothetical protein [Candidatus Omnitrophota bacterium]